MPKKGAFALIGLDEGRNVLAGNDQDVHWSFGVDVGKGVAQRILEDGRGRNLTFDNLAEQAAHSEPSVQDRNCVASAGSASFAAAESNGLQGRRSKFHDPAAVILSK